MRFTIVITGVTRGLGRALAERYIDLNHTVIGCGRNAKIIKDMNSTSPASSNFAVVNIDDYKQNDEIEFEADQILDFTEKNPFGNY